MYSEWKDICIIVGGSLIGGILLCALIYCLDSTILNMSKETLQVQSETISNIVKTTKESLKSMETNDSDTGYYSGVKDKVNQLREASSDILK